MAIIPVGFVEKKKKILDDLARPDSQYSDLSPKGSVDEGIKDLINEINAVEGLVTTSSCAGRVSVFLECSKTDSGDAFDGIRTERLQSVVPGGKGRGGRWLFVSHDPVAMPLETIHEPCLVSKLLGISEPLDHRPLESSTLRSVRFQFEPLILHIMSASLHHAQAVLAAAIEAGFRESGVQSLKCLEDPNAFPMVAVRSSGLALSSIIGFLDERNGEGKVRSLVEENYLRLLLDLANERFQANRDRIERFRNFLLRVDKQKPAWEDKASRSERMRVLGLERQEREREQRNHDGPGLDTDNKLDMPLD